MKLKHNRFERYKSPVFIETGSYCGEGIDGSEILLIIDPNRTKVEVEVFFKPE